MEKQKRITLNADKRKVIADVFQDHFETNSKFKKAWQDAKENYNLLRKVAKEKIETLVRKHHPQEDVDIIRGMINKYGDRNGGQLYEDNCFHVQSDELKLEKDYHGDMVEREQDVHIKFDSEKDFLTSYYRDEMKAKGIDADYSVRLADNYDKRNPTYYNSESAVNKFLGYGSRNDVSGNTMYPKDEWDNDFKLWVIGSDYCSARRFKTNHNEYLWFCNFNNAQSDVIRCHQQLFNHVDKKMQKLKLGLKSYRYFDQAKELADKLGVVLNESILDAHSSMALSIYSPSNLADLLTDEVEQTKEDKIAIARAILKQEQEALN